MNFKETIELMNEVDGLQLLIYSAAWLGNTELIYLETASSKLIQIRDLIAANISAWTREEILYVELRVRAIEHIDLMVIEKSKGQNQLILDLFKSII